MREQLINQIKEMLGTMLCENVDIDKVLRFKTDYELKEIIKRINRSNKKWQESKRRNNGRSR